jgi:hypothetical protein
MSQLITIEDQTSSGTLSPQDLFKLVWGVHYQVVYQYSHSAWVKKELAPRAHVVGLPKGAKPPVGAWNMILLDDSTVAGALGYHEDEQGADIPFSDVFVKTALEDGAAPSEVASHEALEMLVDPYVDKPRTTTHRDKLYIVEVCDPVQGCGYDVGAPEGRETGVIVADFCLPAWFGLDEEGTEMSFRNSVPKAFELAPEGYISIAPENEPEDWKQIFGTQKESLPKWASRLPRIHAKNSSPTAA